jgi:hypothetical protein
MVIEAVRLSRIGTRSLVMLFSRQEKADGSHYHRLVWIGSGASDRELFAL